MGENKNFMVVDENENNSLFWEMTIKELYQDAIVTVCKTGFEALDVAKKEKFDFFASSWELQPMSGLIFMQKLRTIHKNKHTPFLIFSNLLTEADLALATEFGISNYLLPPFEKQRVLDKIQQMFEAEAKLDHVQRTLRKVEDYVNDKKVGEALKLIGDCLKPGPHAAHAYTVNGNIWSLTDHLDKAEGFYKTALKFDPEYMPALNGIARLYTKMKRFEEAAPIFEQLDKKAPKNLDRIINLGTAYLGSGKEDQAQECFKSVAGMDEENQDATAGIGKVEFAKGNLELAAKFFKESGKGGELATYFNSMGISMVNQEKYEEAIKHYQNALTVLPEQNKNHLLHFNIGLAFKKAERFGEATEAFALSFSAQPQYDKAYQAMAFCLREAQTRKQTFDKQTVQAAINIVKARTEPATSDANKTSSTESVEKKGAA